MIALPIVALLLAACGNGADPAADAAGAQQAMPAMPVTVVTLEPRNVSVTADYPARVRAVREVEVRARVGGLLQARHYVEGNAVTAGGRLFGIDSEPFRIAVTRATADVTDAQASLQRAQRELRRMDELYERRSASERDRDEALTQLQLTEARLELARAGLADAQRNLGYTTVEAPIDGMTGMEILAEGSLVEAGTLLTTITQIDPVYVRFSLPEADARRLRAETAGGASVPLSLAFIDGATHHQTGAVDFIDSRVDARTGTVEARGVFANADHTLIPGQFVRVQVPLERIEQGIVVPAGAVGQGPDGPHVFIVDDNDVARARIVTVGPLINDGDNGGQLIRSGLEPGDRVVVSGQVAIGDGAPVSARHANDAPATE